MELVNDGPVTLLLGELISRGYTVRFKDPFHIGRRRQHRRSGSRGRRIRKMARGTFTKGVLTDIGSFGGCFRHLPRMRQPVLVSSVDGVGTKLKIAFATDATTQSAKTWSTIA